MDFASRLKILRAREKITQRQLAEMLNVDRTSVAKWETGKNIANQDILEDICQLFNCTMDYLLGREDSPTREKEKSTEDLDMQQWIAAFKKVGIKPESLEKLNSKDRELIVSIVSKFFEGNK